MFRTTRVSVLPLAVISFLAWTPASAVIIKVNACPVATCVAANGQPKSIHRDLMPVRGALRGGGAHRHPNERVDRAGLLSRPDRSGTPGGVAPLRLSATLPGDWDQVEGFVTFPQYYEEDDVGRLEIVLRGFSAVPGDAENQYVVPAWDRNLFFINPDATDPAEIPRVLATVELESAYQPMPDDDYEIFRDDPPVLAECTGSNVCSIQEVPYAELQEEGRDYTNYPDEAAQVIVYFVINDVGELISAAADIFDENLEYERTDFLYIGDTIEFFATGLNVDQPEFLYIIGYMSPRILSDNFILERTFYIPGVDYEDPDLPKGFDAGLQPVQFLLEGGRAGVGGNPDVWEQAGPFDLGVQWKDLPGFIFRSRFETPTPDRSTAPGRPSFARERPASTE